MAILTVLEWPDQRLRIKAKPVDNVDSVTQKELLDMIETMRDQHGGGLAANQVGINKRMFVMLDENDPSGAKCFVNPEIVAHSGELYEEEGCLSFPGVSALVKRYAKITVKALDFNGQAFEVSYEDDYECRCVQHETDHLNGIVYVDYLSPLKRDMLEKKLKKRRAM